jgi:hypothetical protein
MVEEAAVKPREVRAVWERAAKAAARAEAKAMVSVAQPRELASG